MEPLGPGILEIALLIVGVGGAVIVNQRRNPPASGICIIMEVPERDGRETMVMVSAKGEVIFLGNSGSCYKAYRSEMMSVRLACGAWGERVPEVISLIRCQASSAYCRYSAAMTGSFNRFSMIKAMRCRA